MARVTLPKPVKLIIGTLYQDEDIAQQVKKILTDEYGDIDLGCGPLPFEHTGYYSETGENLRKQLYSFRNLIDRECCADIKLATNGIEERFSENDNRRINIDPGYLTLSNLFLASCKDYYHRVYIGKGIFLENEYFYQNGCFRFWEWTYPDYKSSGYLSFFHEVRKIYHSQLRKL